MMISAPIEILHILRSNPQINAIERLHGFQLGWWITFIARPRTLQRVTCHKRDSLVKFARGCWCSMQ